MVGGWTVKVIGISSRIRKPDLAAILKVSISDIVIPRHQQPGQNRFAYVNNFESEDKANDFAAQWDGVFIQLPLRICIKCEVVRTMVEPQLNITQSLCGISVLLGQDGILKLACGANPSPHIAWFFNGVEVKNSTKYNILSHGNVFTLTVHNCDRQDAGEYRAVITNGINRIEQAGMLRVRMRPTVEASEQVNKQSCEVEQDAQITWKFSGIEIPQVIWYFNGQPLETNDRIQVTGSADGRSTLTIRNTQLLDEGVYTARASNSVGTAEAQTILSIVGIPPVIVTDLEAELQVMREERVTLKLIVKGTPTPKIVWMRDNNELVLDKRVHVTQPAGDNDGIHTLIISNVQTEDQGQYSAKIENIAGSVKSRNCKVTVIPETTIEPIPDEILKEQVVLKQYYDSFPNIDDSTNETRPDIKKAQELTKSILNKKPSGNPSEKDTLCHILNKMMSNQDQQCLFYDSTNGTNLHDASGHIADIDSDDKPFVLKLKSSEGLGNDTQSKTDKDDLRLVQTLNKLLEQNKSDPVIEDICDRLAKAHGVDRNNIVVKSLYCGTFNIVYTVLNLTAKVLQKLKDVSQDLKNQFNQFVSAKIHPLLFRPTFDISHFDGRGDKIFGSQSETHQVGPPGRTKTYTTAAGWTRYGLKVLGKYDNDDWLHPFGHAGNWYRAFHGTANAKPVDFCGSNTYTDAPAPCVDALASIYKTGFRPARVAVYGPGVYCSPNPNWLQDSGYVGNVQLETQNGKKTFKCMFQVAVNPDPKGVNCATNDIWVALTPQDIRPYGILIKEA